MRMGKKKKTMRHALSLRWQHQQQHPSPMQRQAVQQPRLLLSLLVRVMLLGLPLLLLVLLLLRMSAAALPTGLPSAVPAAGERLFYTKQPCPPHLVARTWALHGEKVIAAATTLAAAAGARTLSTASASSLATEKGAPSAALAIVCPCDTGTRLPAATGHPNRALVGRATASTTAAPRAAAFRSRAAAAPGALTAAAKVGWSRTRERKQGLCDANDRHGVRSFVAATATRHPSATASKESLAALVAATEVTLYNIRAPRHVRASDRASCCVSFVVFPLSESFMPKTLFNASSTQTLRQTTASFHCAGSVASRRDVAAFADGAAAASAGASATERNFCYIDSASVRSGLCAAAIRSVLAAARRRPGLCTSTFPAAAGAPADTAADHPASVPAITSAGATRGATKVRVTLVAAAHHPVAAAERNVAPTGAPPSAALAATADGNAAVAGKTPAPAAIRARDSVTSTVAAAAAGAAAAAAPAAATAARSAPSAAAAALGAAGTSGSKATTESGATATADVQVLEEGAPGHTATEIKAEGAYVAAGGSVSGSRVARSVMPVALHALRPITKGVVSAERPVPSSISLPFYALRDESAAAAMRKMQHQEEQQQRREEAVQLRTRLSKYLPISTREIEWVKTSKEIEGIRHACEVAAAVLQKAVDFVRDAADAAAAGQLTTDDIDAVVHAAALEYGAYPSPLRYSSFPKSVCTSVNEVICHGIPDDAALQEGSICSIDVSCYIGGFHGDCARTVTIGRPGSTCAPVLQLVAAAEEATLRGVAACGPGKRLGVVGDAIESFLSSRGYRTIPYFCGHGIGRSFHEEPFIIHVPNSMHGRMLPGMCFTVEPVVCSGGAAYKMWDDKWTVSSLDGAPSAQFEHTVLITDTGVEILTPYPGRASVRQAASSVV